MSENEIMFDQEDFEEVASEEVISETDVTEGTESEDRLSEDNHPTEALPDKKKLTKQQQVWKDVRDILAILVAFMLVYVLFFRVVVVKGDSMNNTLINGDRLLLISNLFYRQPQQGDVIVACKDSFRDGEPIVKRVIAIEGQTIDIDVESSTVYVDGIALEEAYIATFTTSDGDMTFPLTVPEDCIFVMGDNRDNSLDSRSSQIGLIREDEILGKVIFLLIPGTDEGAVAFSLKRIGVVR